MSTSVGFNKGKHYEEILVQALIADHKFAEQMMEVIKVDYFGLEYLKQTCQILFDYYAKYQTFPSLDLIKTIATTEVSNEPLRERILAYIDQVKRDPANGDLEYVKATSLEFCRKRCVMVALENILEYAESKKYNEIIPEIQKALVAGSERDLGHDLVDDFESRMVKAVYKPIPTPWSVVNEVIKGGLGKGKLGCMCASTGVGKSHSLVDLGVAAANAGFTVCHYTFELSEADTGNRYDSRISGISIDNLIEHKGEVQRKVQALPGKIVIKSYPTKTASVANIKNHLHKLSLKGIKPDILIIDYADLMRSRKSYEQKRLEEESVYEELRALAMELDIPIWTATQANRGSLDSEVITLKDIAECFAKAMIVDLFVTINRKKDGNNYSNIGNMFIAKSRLGRDGVKFPMLINTSTSKLEVLPQQFDEDEDDNLDPESRVKSKWKQFLKEGKNSQTKTKKVEDEEKVN